MEVTSGDRFIIILWSTWKIIPPNFLKSFHKMKNIQMKLVNVLYFMYEMGIVGYFFFFRGIFHWKIWYWRVWKIKIFIAKILSWFLIECYWKTPLLSINFSTIYQDFCIFLQYFHTKIDELSQSIVTYSHIVFIIWNATHFPH